MRIVKLTERGCARVLEGKPGMTFVVDKTTLRVDYAKEFPGGEIHHVRDYRYAGDHKPFQIWSLAPLDYEEITN